MKEVGKIFQSFMINEYERKAKLDNVSGNNTATRLILPSTTFPSIELPDILPQGLLLHLQ